MSETVRISQGDLAPPSVSAWAKGRLGTMVADRYRIEEVLSENELGVVYRAEHVPMRLRVAFKVLHPGASPEVVARFEREVVAGAHVRHPNVAGVSDSGVLPDGAHYLVVEHVPGTTLRQVLNNGPLPVARACQIARQLALALGAAHEHGIIHRDLEPQNVMLTGLEGQDVKLIDFGVAKVDMTRFSDPSLAEDIAKKDQLTAVGTFVGNRAYLPPEAALGVDSLDPRADLYSLGVVLYEMLVGKRPFDEDGPAGLLAKETAVDDGDSESASRTSSDPRSFREAAPDRALPAELEAVVMHLLQRDRDARYPSAAAAGMALEAALRSVRVQAAVAEAVAAAPHTDVDPSVPPPPEPTGFGILASRPDRGQPRRGMSGRVRRALEDGSDWLLAGLPGLEKRWDRWALPRWTPILVVVALPLAIVVASIVTFRSTGASPASSAASIASVPAGMESVQAPAAQSATSSAAATGEGLDGAARRRLLVEAVKNQDWKRGGEAVLALVDREPESFRDPEVVRRVIAVAAGLDTTGAAAGDEVFRALGTRLGADGLDVLFEIATTRKGSSLEKRAADILRDQDVIPMESAALRIAFDLWEAGCDQKRPLFQRAVDEGDQRALIQLQALRAMECDTQARRKHSPCCFQGDASLAKAIRDLKTRLEK